MLLQYFVGNTKTRKSKCPWKLDKLNTCCNQCPHQTKSGESLGLTRVTVSLTKTLHPHGVSLNANKQEVQDAA